MGEFITLKEAANLSGYHQDYLGQLIRSGKISGRRVGKEWLVTRNTLAKYMAVKNKVPAVRKKLTLSWWRRHARLTVSLVVIGVLILSILTAINYETLRSIVATGDFNNSRKVDQKKVLITDDKNKTSNEFVVTGYALDKKGNVEISVTAKP